MAATFDHLVDETAWRTSLKKLGMDVTLVSSKPKYTTKTEAAREKEIYLRLRNGEKLKFQRRGKTDKSTMITMTGDQIMGDIIRNNMALLPIAISPHGKFGSIFNRFLYGNDPLPLPDFAEGRVNAEAAARIARYMATCTPRHIIQWIVQGNGPKDTLRSTDGIGNINLHLIPPTTSSRKKQIQATLIMQIQSHMQMLRQPRRYHRQLKRSYT